MNPTEPAEGPVLHLVHGEPDATVSGVVEAQRAMGVPVEVVRCDQVTDWGAVVDRVLEARAVCSW